MKNARVLIVDDHPLVRRALAGLLDRQSGIEVCGEVEDAAGALEAAEHERPDVMLIDLSLKDSDGLDLIRRVRARHPAIRVLVVSMRDERLYAERALRAGASGYVEKQAPVETVLEAIRAVLADRVYVSPAVADRSFKRLADKAPDGGHLNGLSDRELEVLDLLGRGLTTKEVAGRLGLSVKTVYTYRERLMEKLGLSDSSELVRYAIARQVRETSGEA